MYFSMRIIDIKDNWTTGGITNIDRSVTYIDTYIRFPSIIYDIIYLTYCISILYIKNTKNTKKRKIHKILHRTNTQHFYMNGCELIL